MQPYVKKDVTGDTARHGDPMPLTRQGLVSATGVSALRSNPSTNTTRNLALGSGVAYTGTSLFLPTELKIVTK